MRSNGPITLSFPAFRGVTRRLILIALVGFVGSLVLGFMTPDTTIVNLLTLHPDQALHLVWQFWTYPFLPTGFISLLFALLSVWFFGSALEDELGSLWLTEYFLVATIGGGLLACLLTRAADGRIPHLSSHEATWGMWPAVLALLVAYAYYHAEEKLRFNFIFEVKAKYLAAGYVAFYLIAAMLSGDRLGAVTALCVALSGYIFLRLAPRKGLRFTVSEKWFSMRNAYYRAKRRRAAKKFTVYMKKQGKDVSLDADGRYVGPDERDPNGRDPNDKRWMN